jgi:hypothetical protein
MGTMGIMYCELWVRDNLTISIMSRELWRILLWILL